MATCTVIIPAYNCEEFLPACLESVCAQSMPNLEILVVDDGSTDGTAAVVTEFSKKDGRVKLLLQPTNLGVAAARNRGVREATGDYIAFLDADDLWLPEKLEKQLAFLNETKADLCYTAASCINDHGEALPNRFLAPETVTYRNLLKGNVIVCSSVLAKAVWLKKYPMEKGNFHEDYVCWLSMLKDGAKAVGITDPLTVYRFTSGSISRNKGKSAKMTWAVYQRMGLSLPTSIYSFCRYALHGIRRYFA